jgi:hypothetical protein
LKRAVPTSCLSLPSGKRARAVAVWCIETNVQSKRVLDRRGGAGFDPRAVVQRGAGRCVELESVALRAHLIRIKAVVDIGAPRLKSQRISRSAAEQVWVILVDAFTAIIPLCP